MKTSTCTNCGSKVLCDFDVEICNNCDPVIRDLIDGAAADDPGEAMEHINDDWYAVRDLED